MMTDTPPVDPVRQEFIDMYEETLVDAMEAKNNDISEDEERNLRLLRASTERFAVLISQISLLCLPSLSITYAETAHIPPVPCQTPLQSHYHQTALS